MFSLCNQIPVRLIKNYYIESEPHTMYWLKFPSFMIFQNRNYNRRLRNKEMKTELFRWYKYTFQNTKPLEETFFCSTFWNFHCNLVQNNILLELAEEIFRPQLLPFTRKILYTHTPSHTEKRANKEEKHLLSNYCSKYNAAIQCKDVWICLMEVIFAQVTCTR